MRPFPWRILGQNCRAIACPIINHVKGDPFEVSLSPGEKISVVVLAQKCGDGTAPTD